MRDSAMSLPPSIQYRASVILPLAILHPLSSIIACLKGVLHLVAACCTWLQLSGEKNWNREAENLRFQLRKPDAQQIFADCQCPYHARFTYASGLRGFPHFPFHLVSPGCTYDTLKHDKTRYF